MTEDTTADVGDEQDEIERRLDRLETQIQEQQATIEQQQARIEEQATIIETQRQRLDGEDEGETVVNRRTALKAGGVLGLLGIGAGTASADASGQIGTSSDPLQDLYTEKLNGGVTGNTELTNLTGSNLSIDNSGTLNASGGGGSVGNSISVDDISDDGSGSVTMGSTLDLSGNDLVDGGATLWDQDNGYIPQGRLENTDVTVAGNAVSLGGSTGIAHGDLDSVSADQHHAKDHDHSEAGISTVPNAGLSNDTITRTAGTGLTYSSGSAGTALGGSATLKIAADGVTGTEIDLSTIAGDNISVDTTNNELDASGGGGDTTTLKTSGGTTALSVLDAGENQTSASGTMTSLVAGNTVLETSPFDSENEVLLGGGITENTIRGQQTRSNTLSGGGGNSITDEGTDGTLLSNVISGGGSNTIKTDTNHSVIGGGNSNTIDLSGNDAATIAGGEDNTATGFLSVIPGGKNNTASGDKSFAAGRQADTNSNNGAFVWGDASSTAVKASAPDEVRFQATGGFVIAPEADRTTMLDVQDKDDNSVLTVDTSNDTISLNGNTLTGTQSIHGGVTGNTELTNIAGSNLSIDNSGNLNASGGGGSLSKLVTSASGMTAFEVIEGGTIVSSDNPGSPVPNVFGGHPTNHSDSNPVEAVTVSGGYNNIAGGDTTTIGGGTQNEASGLWGVVSGGKSNESTKKGATVGGGRECKATGQFATVPGGELNTADGNHSFAAGQEANTGGNDGAFVWGDSSSTAVTSGAADEVRFQATGGFVIAPEADQTTMLDVQDKDDNSVLTVDTSNDEVSLNGNTLTGTQSITGGVTGNTEITDLVGNGLTINSGSLEASGGSSSDTLVTDGSTRAVKVIDATDSIPTDNPDGSTPPNVIGGHPSNNTRGNAKKGITIAGGGGDSDNSNAHEASQDWATIGGGVGNTASGESSTVSGGSKNQANGNYAAVGGGQSNQANGTHAAIPGGQGNVASGDHSVAAGRRANAQGNAGAFVWGDSSATFVNSGATDEVRFQATGGFVIAPEADRTTMLDVQDKDDNSVLTVDTSNDNVTVNGRVEADAHSTNNVTISDDDVHQFAPSRNAGKLTIHEAANNNVIEILFDLTGGASAITEVAQLGDGFETGTGDHTGTTGTDGKITVAVDYGNRAIDIENRSGSQLLVYYTVIQ